jgi:hypothetical protein
MQRRKRQGLSLLPEEIRSALILSVTLVFWGIFQKTDSVFPSRGTLPAPGFPGI